MNSLPAWQRRRSAFNHDWLKNQYLTALGSWINLLDSKISDPELEATFVSHVLPQWEKMGQRAFSLISDFDKEMSPRRLFDYVPLSRCDLETKNWLGDLTHEVWMFRYDVESLVNCALSAYERANPLYYELVESLNNLIEPHSINELRSCRPLFVKFKAHCQDLAKAIERFPGTIKVI